MMALLAVVVVVLLTACGAPSQGDIVKKKFTPERYWETMEPVYSSKSYPCTKTRTKTTTSNGKTTTTTVPYSSTCTKQVKTGTHEVDHYTPEKYLLRIKDGDNEGWVTVSEETYEDASVGDYYNEGSIE